MNRSLTKIIWIFLSCFLLLSPLSGKKKTKERTLKSAEGKTLNLPYSQMALTAKFIGPAVEEKGWFNWCVSPIIGKDKKVHIFSSRWPKAEGMEGWSEKNAEIAHFIADRPEGPFR